MSMFFEDLKVGEKFKAPFSRTITETDTVNFLNISGTFESILIDKEHYEKSSFGMRIAPGILILAISMGLSSLLALTDSTAVALLGLDHVKFLKAVVIGDTLSTTVEITDKRGTRNPAHGVVTYKHTTQNQKGEAVLEFERIQLVKTRAFHGH